MKRTRLQDLLGIEMPIVQAPMAGVQDHRLAVAVSNAGALGSLPCANPMSSSGASSRRPSACSELMGHT